MKKFNISPIKLLRLIESLIKEITNLHIIYYIKINNRNFNYLANVKSSNLELIAFNLNKIKY